MADVEHPGFPCNHPATIDVPEVDEAPATATPKKRVRRPKPAPVAETTKKPLPTVRKPRPKVLKDSDKVSVVTIRTNAAGIINGAWIEQQYTAEAAREMSATYVSDMCLTGDWTVHGRTDRRDVRAMTNNKGEILWVYIKPFDTLTNLRKFFHVPNQFN